jgi:muconolactone delta-isomerase
VEFLVEFEVEVPNGTPESEVERRTRAEASAAAKLADWLQVTITPLAPHPNDPGPAAR